MDGTPAQDGGNYEEGESPADSPSFFVGVPQHSNTTDGWRSRLFRDDLNVVASPLCAIAQQQLDLYLTIGNRYVVILDAARSMRRAVAGSEA